MSPATNCGADGNMCAIARRNTGSVSAAPIQNRRVMSASSAFSSGTSLGLFSTPEPFRKSGNSPVYPPRSPDASGRCRSPCLAPSEASQIRGPCHISDNRLADRSPRLGTSGRNISWSQTVEFSRSSNARRGSMPARPNPYQDLSSVTKKPQVSASRTVSHGPELTHVPGGIRTPNLLIRSQKLYPVELQAH